MRRYEILTSLQKRKTGIDYSKELNPEQFEVVTKGDGPVLVLAGPGSGKTRTLIYRVAFLLEQGVYPQNILLVTFTNKAAREMLDRIESLLKMKPKGLWGGTFHHIGNLCLRRHASLLGYNKDFGILDREDSRDLINSCLEELGIDTKARKFPRANVIGAIISFSTNSLQSIEETITLHYPYFGKLIPQIKRLAKHYAHRKKESNNMDYDDLLAKWKELLETFPEVRDYYGRIFKYILVDEYQDTNRLQFEILKNLAHYSGNILVVGDDAQSIYSFRAAEIKNILEFPHHFPETKIFRLETNYRSSPEILELANESIKNNLHQFPKHLKSIQERGEMPAVIPLRDTKQEAAFVAQRILELGDEGISLNEMAVLFRARYQAMDLELELSKRGIPYVVRGGMRFFEQAHIKDILAHLKILVNPKDELSWKRILMLHEGIGRSYAHRIWQTLNQYPDPIQHLLSKRIELSLSQRAKRGLEGFLKILKPLSQPEIRENPSGMIKEIIKNGYEQYVEFAFEDAEDRLQDLVQLANLAQAYDSVEKFLAGIIMREEFKGETILRGAREEDERIVLSTIHQAKGLEWRVVMTIGAVAGQFPHPKALGDSLQMEEERRLFYVAITRAKRELYITYPIYRPDYNRGEIISRPSLFIQELPERCYEVWSVTEGED